MIWHGKIDRRKTTSNRKWRIIYKLHIAKIFKLRKFQTNLIEWRIDQLTIVFKSTMLRPMLVMVIFISRIDISFASIWRSKSAFLILMISSAWLRTVSERPTTFVVESTVCCATDDRWWLSRTLLNAPETVKCLLNKNSGLMVFLVNSRHHSFFHSFAHSLIPSDRRWRCTYALSGRNITGTAQILLMQNISCKLNICWDFVVTQLRHCHFKFKRPTKLEFTAYFVHRKTNSIFIFWNLWFLPVTSSSCIFVALSLR